MPAFIIPPEAQSFMAVHVIPNMTADVLETKADGTKVYDDVRKQRVNPDGEREWQVGCISLPVPSTFNPHPRAEITYVGVAGKEPPVVFGAPVRFENLVCRTYASAKKGTAGVMYEADGVIASGQLHHTAPGGRGSEAGAK